MFDNHYPLLKYAFWSDEYYPVILENDDNITDTGLRYVNNEMCYPCILNIGQIINALKSSNYDLKNTLLLIPAISERCLGSNYTEILRQALKKADIPDVEVITFNMNGDNNKRIHMQYFMFYRALFSMQYGDLLLFLTQQIRPYEKVKGATEECRSKWIKKLSEDFKGGSALSPLKLKKSFTEIIEDFKKIPRTNEAKQRVGIVGEIFTRYCKLGNRNIVSYLEENGCETFTNGLSYYFLYYIDTHKDEAHGAARFKYNAISKYILTFQKLLLRCLRKAGMFAFTDYSSLKKQFGKEKMELDSVGDGWLISMDTYGCFKHGFKKILGVQPFRCISSHIYGRGQYAAMARKYDGRIVSLDFDSRLPLVNIHNRIHLLIDNTI